MNGHDAIARFRREQGLPADGGEDRWIDWTRMFGLPVPIPNASVRRPLVPYHDLHHILSGHGTDELGEAFVSAWTMGTGGRQPFWGHLYDLGAVVPGLLRAPRATFAAFLRGRRARNVYAHPVDELLDREEAALFDIAGVDRDGTEVPRARLADVLAFAALFPQIMIFWLIPLAPTAVAIVFAIDLLTGRLEPAR
jgi:hypothetical protein